MEVLTREKRDENECRAVKIRPRGHHIFPESTSVIGRAASVRVLHTNRCHKRAAGGRESSITETGRSQLPKGERKGKNRKRGKEGGVAADGCPRGEIVKACGTKGKLRDQRKGRTAVLIVHAGKRIIRRLEVPSQKEGGGRRPIQRRKNDQAYKPLDGDALGKRRMVQCV